MQYQADLDKTPPHDRAAELAVIGCALVTPEAIVEVGELYPTDFFSQECQEAWGAIQGLVGESLAVDIVTVGQRLKDSGCADRFEGGWATWAVSASSNVPTVHNVKHYADIVRNKAILRKLIAVAIETMSRSYSGAKAEDVLLDLTSAVSELQTRATSKEPALLKDAIPVAIETISMKCDPRNHNVLVRTGIAPLDAHIGGLAPEEMVVVAARPGVGKTSWANGVAEYAAGVCGIPTLYISVEMSQQQQIERFISMESGIPATAFRSGRIDGKTLTLDHHKKVLQVGERLMKMPLWIDAESMTLGRILSTSRRWHAKHAVASGMKICLIVIDYLQLIAMQAQEKPIPREQQVAMISKSCKWLAKTLKCPVLVCSQLNRKVEERGGEPVLSDLRECLTGETRIWDAATGGTVSVRDLSAGGNALVWGIRDRYQIGSAMVSKAWSTGVKPVYRVQTASGRVIRATGNHPFLTVSGWTKLAEVALGERIAVPRFIPQHACKYNPHTVDQLRLLGFLISDGHYGKNRSVGYVKGDHVLVDEVRRIAKSSFGIDAKDHPCHGIAQQIELTTKQAGPGCNPVINWLKALGVHGQLGPKKRIPESVFTCDNDHVAEFLGALWSGDGSVVQRKTGGWVLKFASTSRGLLQDIQRMLLRFGIVSVLGNPRRNSKSTMDIATVTIGDGDAIAAFARQIRLHGEKQRKLEIAAQWVASEREHENARADRMPIEITAHVSALKEKRGWSWEELGYRCQKKEMSRASLGKVARKLDDDKLLALSDSDILWDQVVAISPDGNEEVFDVSVPAMGNFVADGFFVHNSGAIEQDADIVFFLHRSEDEQSTVEGEVISWLIAGKNRNGPVGKYKMKFVGGRTKFFGAEQDDDGARDAMGDPADDPHWSDR